MKAKTMGITRLLLKNNSARMHFIDNPQSAFFQSECFGKILQWVQQHPREVQIQQKNEKLVLIIKKINNIEDLKDKLNEISTGASARL